MMQEKKKNWFLIVFFTILGLIGGAILIALFLTVNKEMKAEARLTAMRDDILNTEEINMNIISNGEYAKIEKVMKDYYQEYFGYYNEMIENDYIAVFNNVTPEFLTYESYNLPKLIEGLDNYQEKTNHGLDGMIYLLDENVIEGMFHDANIDDYHFDFYKELMILDTDKETRETWENYKLENETKMGYIRKMLNILNDYPDSWYVENETLYFIDEDLLSEYNYYYEMTFEDENIDHDYPESNFM